MPQPLSIVDKENYTKYLCCVFWWVEEKYQIYILSAQVNVSELGLVTQGGKVVWGKPTYNVILHFLEILSITCQKNTRQ